VSSFDPLHKELNPGADNSALRLHVEAAGDMSNAERSIIAIPVTPPSPRFPAIMKVLTPIENMKEPKMTVTRLISVCWVILGRMANFLFSKLIFLSLSLIFTTIPPSLRLSHRYMINQKGKYFNLAVPFFYFMLFPGMLTRTLPF